MAAKETIITFSFKSLESRRAICIESLHDDDGPGLGQEEAPSKLLCGELLTLASLNLLLEHLLQSHVGVVINYLNLKENDDDV